MNANKRRLHFLYKTWRGSYCFRARVPKRHLDAFEGKQEIRISLQTDSFLEARSRLSVYVAEFLATIAELDKKPMPRPPNFFGLITVDEFFGTNGQKNRKISIDFGGDEEKDKA